MATELDEILDDAKRARAQSAVGERLRATPAPDLSELARRTTPTTPETAPAKVPRAVSLNPAQAPGSIADLSRPFVQQEAAPVSNPNVAKGMLSAEGVQAQNALRGTQAVTAPASPVVEAAPVTEAAPAKPSIYQRITSAASESARPLVPNTGAAGGAIAKVAGAVGSAGLGLARRAAPFVEPAIETARVARVALDPQATQLDVATQTAEGVGRTASTIAGAGLGGAAGAAVGGPFAPVTGAIGALAGGAVGYIGGDAAIKALRRSVGLDSDSPVERSDARNTPAAPAAAKPAAAPVAAAAPVTAKPTIAAVAAQAPAAARAPAARSQPVAAQAPASAAPSDAVAQQLAQLFAEERKDVGAGGKVENGMATIDYVKASKDQAWLARHEDRQARFDALQPLIPQNPNGVVRLDPGGQWSVGGVSMPESIVRGGEQAQGQYIAAVNKGAQEMANPSQARIDQELATIGAQGQNQKTVADIQAASAANVAGINERGSNYRADSKAESEKWVYVPPKIDPTTGAVLAQGGSMNTRTGEVIDTTAKGLPPGLVIGAPYKGANGDHRLPNGGTMTVKDGKVTAIR